MKRGEEGIALVITLFLMATLSALAVSLMFLSQTETASSRNYRTMSQARYAGESGVHRALNYLMYSYTAPASPFTGFGTTKTPVTCTAGCTHTTAGTCDASTVKTAIESGCIVLATCAADDTGSSTTCPKTNTATAVSNYPTASVVTAFMSAAKGTLAANSSGVTNNAAFATEGYSAVAILMSMRTVNSYGGASGVVQTWQVISDGTAGTGSALVEVSGMLERQFGDAQTFAVFATGNGCGAINLQGNVQTASYDSSVGTTVSNSGGNVGTNGNLSIGGHVDVHGSLSSPRTGVGTCTDSATGVTALTTSGAATVDNSALTQLPQALTFTTPALPNPLPSATTTVDGCSDISLTLPATCTSSGGTITIDPMGTTVSMGNLSGNFVLKGGTYNINSIGAGNLNVGTSLLGATNVVINLAGKTSTGTDMANPFNLNGHDVVNSSMKAERLQILYAGTGTFDLTGGSNASMLLYAPNATVQTHGNGDIWGSILARQVTSAGTPRFIYDRHLDSTFYTVGNWVMTSFNWKKY